MFSLILLSLSLFSVVASISIPRRHFLLPRLQAPSGWATDYLEVRLSLFPPFHPLVSSLF
jgi:hypothetical protein